MTDDSGVTVEPLASRSSSDAELVDRLVEIVNAAYALAENGMWEPGTPRVTTSEMRALIEADEIVVARLGDRLVGCVRVHPVDETTSGFGMLAAAQDARGVGVGRELVKAVERGALESGASVMQLELLVPTERVQESKTVLAEWYSRAGYRRVLSKPIAEDYPELAALLVMTCDYQVWLKRLA